MAKDIAPSPLVYNGEIITQRDERISLTDMWKASGADLARAPAEWLRSADAQRFVEFLAEAHNMGNSHVIAVKRGKGGGTFGHWQVGLAYAKYLSPEFHVWCNTVVRERMEGRPAVSHVVLDESMKSAIGGIVKSVTGAIVRDAMEVILPRLLEADPRAAATEFMPALDVLVEKGVPSRHRRAFSQKVSGRLRRYSTSHGHPMRISRPPSRYMFHVDAISGWMREEGTSMIASHVAALAGQGALQFPRPTDG